MIVGVDRLDYSKGLEERFLGYERFLLENPEERKEVFLLQIAPPSRGTVESYKRIRSTSARCQAVVLLCVRVCQRRYLFYLLNSS